MEIAIYKITAVFMSFVMALVYFYLYMLDRKQYLGIWTASFAFYALGQSLGLLTPPDNPAILFALGKMMPIISGVLLIWGTHLFLDKNFAGWWTYGMLLSGLWVLASIVLDIETFYVSLPLFIYAGIIYIQTGLMFIGFREIEGDIRYITGGGFVIWGLYYIGLPLMTLISLWQFLFTTMAAIITSTGVLLIYFRKISCELLHSEQRFHLLAEDRKKAEEELQKSEELYRMLAENITDVIWTCDMNFNFTYISPSDLLLRGYTFEEVKKQRLDEILVPQSCELALKTMEEEVLKDRERGHDPNRAKTLEVKMYRKDGSTIWVELKLIFLRDREGLPAGILGVSRDISGRKRVEEAFLEKNRMLTHLSEFTGMCLELPFAVVNFNIMAEQLLSMTGAKFVLIQSQEQSTRNTRVEALAGEEEFLNVIGPNVIGSTWKVDDTSWKMMKTGKLDRIAGIYNLAFGNIPPEVSAQIEEHLNIGEIYALGLVRQGQVMGNLVIIMPAGRELVEKGIVEIFARVAAATLSRKNVEEALQKSERLYRMLAENVTDVIWTTDLNLNFTYVSPSVKTLLDYDAEEALTHGIDQLLTPSSLQLAINTLQEEMLVEEKGLRPLPREITLEFEVVRRDKSTVWVDTRLAFLRDEKGNAMGILGVSRDITERRRVDKALRETNEKLETLVRELSSAQEELKKNYEEIKNLNLYDTLTGLYNRAFFEEELARFESEGSDSVGIIVCDVDGLKLVNDSLGHSYGDSLLVVAANLAKECFRKNDIVARIGGDEFAVLIPNGDTVAEKACIRFRDVVARYNAENPELPLSISIGFATSKTNTNLNQVLKEADNNMCREKLLRSQSARSAIVQTLMKALEERDFITEGHAERLQVLVRDFARALGFSDRGIADMCLLAQFHDIGKVGIPDRILFKPGPLTLEEASEMHRHCEIGYRIAKSAPDLAPIADWILKHHEWWNGRGYPLGLSGEEIPLECRILTIADAYDTMTSDRPYRKAMNHKEAIEELERCSGTQFDPSLTEKLIKVLKNKFVS